MEDPDYIAFQIQGQLDKVFSELNKPSIQDIILPICEMFQKKLPNFSQLDLVQAVALLRDLRRKKLPPGAFKGGMIELYYVVKRRKLTDIFGECISWDSEIPEFMEDFF